MAETKKSAMKKLLESKLICNEIKKAKYYYLCILYHRYSYFVLLDNGNSMLLWKKVSTLSEYILELSLE